MRHDVTFDARGLAQFEFRRHFGKRHSIFRSGWDGGKTYTGGDKAMHRASVNRMPGLLGGSNYQHLTQVMIPTFMDAARRWNLEPELRVGDRIVLLRGLPRTNQFGCQFAYCRSGDAPTSIRAISASWGWFDEPAAFKRSDADASQDAFLQFMGRIRGDDVLPGIDWTGTNEGDGTRFYSLQTSGRDDVAVFTGSSRDNNRHHGQEFIDNVLLSLPTELHEQYLEGGVGQLAQEMAAWEWRREFEQPCQLAPEWPIVTCFDFGIAPMAMSYCQEIGEGESLRFNWLGEVVMKARGNTADVTRTFCERMRPQHAGPVIVTGDPSGKAGSPQSKHENYQQIYAIMSEYWPGQVLIEVMESAPSIQTRLLRANAALKRGIVRVDPSCANLLRDLRGCKLVTTDGGMKESQKDGYSHSLVGMFYRLHQRCPISEVKQHRGGAHGQMVSRARGTPVDARSTVAGRIGR